MQFPQIDGNPDESSCASDQLVDSIRTDLQELSQMFACLSPGNEDLDGNDLYAIVRARAAIERGIALAGSFPTQRLNKNVGR